MTVTGIHYGTGAAAAAAKEAGEGYSDLYADEGSASVICARCAFAAIHE